MTALEVSTEHAPLQARRVSFDWAQTPLHWVPNDPFSTHMINVLHLLLPAGERWFVDVYKQALPLVKDARLREDMIGFIGQEAVHSQAHSTVLDHMIAQGLDPSPYTDQMDWFFEHLLGDHTAPPAAAAWWLKERVAIIAAIEHFTAVLGKWVLEAQGFERYGADPVMVDLLRWHGAEEVEHRSVAFDVYQHLDGRYGRRIRAMTTVFPTMAWLWIRGVKFFMANDPGLTPAQRRALEPKMKDWVRAAKADLVPTPKDIFSAVPRFMRKRYHPTQEGSTAKALSYLAGSPAARAAAEQAEAATRPLQLVVAQRREPAEGVAELVLSSASGAPLPAWEPGAHLDLLLPSGLVRQYSLCGDPADRDAYRIGVRLTQDTRGGSMEVHETLRAGASVQAHRPRNRFPLAPGKGPRYFVAGGIGITAILPMVRESAARASDWRLLYVGRSRASMPFLDEITALADAESRVTVVETDVDGLPDLSVALESAPHGAIVHVCGPEPLMEAVVATLAELRPGIEARLERFHPAEGSVHGDTVAVELRRTGTALTVPADRSVLSAVREQLPNVPYSCEQGFCGTCKVRVLGGTPEHRDDLLTVEERADSMLICVSRSQDGKLVLDL